VPAPAADAAATMTMASAKTSPDRQNRRSDEDRVTSPSRTRGACPCSGEKDAN